MPTTSPRRIVLHLLAALFALCATAYSILWIIQIKRSTPQPGFTNYRYFAASSSITVGNVNPGSPAEEAGLRAGDRIVAIGGKKLETLRPFYEAIVIGNSDAVEFTVEDPTTPDRLRQRYIVVHGGRHVPPRTMRLADLPGLTIDYYPLGFLVVGIAVLVLRPDDLNAWLLALLFGGFLAIAPLFEGNIPPTLRGFVLSYKIAMSWSSLALFYYFFAVFPAPSPLDRRVPWLKYILLAAPILTAVPVAVRCLIAGGTLPLYLGFRWPGARVVAWVLAFQTGLPLPVSGGWPPPSFVFFASFVGALILGLLSLLTNAFLSPDAPVRRKARVMVWGTVLGTAPVTAIVGLTFFAGITRIPLAVWQISVLFLSTLWPLSFAYAVVKHRVLEIPALLRHSARYVLVQRGYIMCLFLAAAIAIALFTHTVSRFFPEGSNIGMTMSAVFGIALVWMAAPVVKRGTERIDRAFFRGAYDARLILQDLVEKTRAVTDRHELASLLENKIAGAMHPLLLACYLEGEDGQLVAESAQQLRPLRANLEPLRMLAQHGRAWDVPQGTSALTDLIPFAPECMVPILARDGRLIGLLALGPRLSEEPYSSGDKTLLNSVASQAGLSLENIRLAEKMAERIEGERRAAMEMDIARRVQARLFPQKLPPLSTLEYVGGCLQARQVGGDYYDFLDMGPGAVGIVLADISGKGISGALLMANLQANLRSQYAVALDDLPRLLRSVNRLFYENTTDESYATMFFGVYEDSNRTLRFANCGHTPPVIIRHDGAVQRLSSTTTVLGMFYEWDSPIEQAQLHPGDLLIIYTDGVTEAPNSMGEEFGEDRLVQIARDNCALPFDDLLAKIQASVQEFSGATQADDITLILARCR